MAKQAGIPCGECDYRFPDSWKKGRNQCPNCLTEWVFSPDENGECVMREWKPLRSESTLKNYTRVKPVYVGKASDEAMASLPPFPKVEEIDHTYCYFCHLEVGYHNSNLGLIETKQPLIQTRSKGFYNRATGVYQNIPEEYIAGFKKLKVTSCSNCVDKLDEVLPQPQNLVVDRWSKSTGARAQHYTRSVSEDRRHEAKEPLIPRSKGVEPMPLKKINAPVGATVFYYERFNKEAHLKER